MNPLLRKSIFRTKRIHNVLPNLEFYPARAQAESARAVTDRRCPMAYSGRGEDFLTGQPDGKVGN